MAYANSWTHMLSKSPLAAKGTVECIQELQAVGVGTHLEILQQLAADPNTGP